MEKKPVPAWMRRVFLIGFFGFGAISLISLLTGNWANLAGLGLFALADLGLWLTTTSQ